jgi:mono/diheme cytochrome c family protein
MTKRAGMLLCLLLLGFPFGPVSAVAETSRKTRQPAGDAVFQTRIKPLLGKYCVDCHGEKKKGDLDLRVYTDAESVLRDRRTFAKVVKNLQAHEMPPEKKPQPTAEERELITAWIQSEIFKCDCDHPDPGRVTIRRLNRAEYNNTIRDLVGVNFQPADDFPADDSGYGFDNIGDVLSLPPVLLEKYLAAAQKILSKAVVTDLRPKSPVKRFDADGLDGTAPSESLGGGIKRLGREGDIFSSVRFPHDGEYLLRAKAYGEQAGPEPARMSFSLDGKELKKFDVTAEEPAPQVYEVRVQVSAGTHRFSAAYLNNYRNPKDPNPKNRDRNLVIHYLEVEDTDPGQPPVLPETHKRIFVRQPTPETKIEVARETVGRFAASAFRRPVVKEEVDRLMKLFALADSNGESFEKSVELALEAVLVSPSFLFRGELQPDPNNPAVMLHVEEFALASRLSYFLWSSMPDDELRALAGRKALRKNLDQQVKRMLKDPKAHALVENFAGQWLQIRNLKLVAPDKNLFPEFDDNLRAAMAEETELFFTEIVRQDRSVLDFLDADYTFVNGRLAKLYDLSGIEGEEFQRVSLKGTHRGGLLTQASILTVTSTPTRTSPVKRGKWVLENLLGTPPPPPPPDVPEFKEGKEAALTGTLRQRMEQHRENPMCAACHARMDPIGFGMENFNGIGQWREKEGEFSIDPAGKLVSGETFNGPADLKSMLFKSKRDDFVRCLTEKMLTYALGRGLEFYDKCALDQITKRLAKDRFKFSTLILEIVKSTPFDRRRGEEEQVTEAKR